jgi:hypothetical protein
MKKLNFSNIDTLSLGDFYRSYATIALQKETVAIKRFRAVEGYFVPSQEYEKFLEYLATAKNLT